VEIGLGKLHQRVFGQPPAVEGSAHAPPPRLGGVEHNLSAAILNRVEQYPVPLIRGPPNGKGTPAPL
jgi:hypothetical protein